MARLLPKTYTRTNHARMYKKPFLILKLEIRASGTHSASHKNLTVARSTDVAYNTASCSNDTWYEYTYTYRRGDFYAFDKSMVPINKSTTIVGTPVHNAASTTCAALLFPSVLINRQGWMLARRKRSRRQHNKERVYIGRGINTRAESPKRPLRFFPSTHINKKGANQQINTDPFFTTSLYVCTHYYHCCSCQAPLDAPRITPQFFLLPLFLDRFFKINCRCVNSIHPLIVGHLVPAVFLLLFVFFLMEFFLLTTGRKKVNPTGSNATQLRPYFSASLPRRDLS